MFEIVFEFCAMVFVIVTVGVWVITLPILTKRWVDDVRASQKYYEERDKLLKEAFSIGKE